MPEPFAHARNFSKVPGVEPGLLRGLARKDACPGRNPARPGCRGPGSTSSFSRSSRVRFLCLRERTSARSPSWIGLLLRSNAARSHERGEATRAATPSGPTALPFRSREVSRGGLADPAKARMPLSRSSLNDRLRCFRAGQLTLARASPAASVRSFNCKLNSSNWANGAAETSRVHIPRHPLFYRPGSRR